MNSYFILPFEATSSILYNGSRPTGSKSYGLPTSSEIIEFMEELTKKGATSETIGKTYENREMTLLRLEKNPENPEILITSLIHGDEVPGLSVALSIFAKLVVEQNHKNSPAYELTRSLNFAILPVWNVDALLFGEEHGLRNVRKNRGQYCALNDSRQGVDLNRNWDVNFTQTSDECSVEFPGYKAFSEPETRAVHEYLEKKKIRMMINFHAYGNMLVYPYNSGRKELSPKDKDFFEVLGKAFEGDNVEASAGSAMDVLHYRTSGEAEDYVMDKYGIKAIAVEVCDSKFPEPEDLKNCVKRNEERFFKLFYYALPRVELTRQGDELELKNHGLGEASLETEPEQKFKKIKPGEVFKIPISDFTVKWRNLDFCRFAEFDGKITTGTCSPNLSFLENETPFRGSDDFASYAQMSIFLIILLPILGLFFCRRRNQPTYDLQMDETTNPEIEV